MNKSETLIKVYEIMESVKAFCLNTVAGPNESLLEFWVIKDTTCIIQYWKEGGCQHYISGNSNTWAQMIQDLEKIS